MKIYSAISLGKRESEHLQKGADGNQILFEESFPKGERKQIFLESDICFGNVAPSWLEETRRLQWIQLESVGFGEYQNLATNHTFAMTNLKGFFAAPVAETALAGILGLYRGIDRMVTYKERKIWEGAALRSGLHLLKDSNVLILGGGTIGQRLKSLLTPFGAKMYIFDKYLHDADLSDESQMDAALRRTDVLVSCLPETIETNGLLNASRLGLLSRHAIFVNLGRGSVVDEQALVHQLKKGRLGGCVLDVTLQEPLPEDHPLWDCPNTILTQHTGGGFEEELLGKVRLFLMNLDLFVRGESLVNIVDMKKGY